MKKLDSVGWLVIILIGLFIFVKFFWLIAVVIVVIAVVGGGWLYWKNTTKFL